MREKYKLRNRLPVQNITVVNAISLRQDSTIINNNIPETEADGWIAQIAKEELNAKHFLGTVGGLNEIANAFFYLITPKIGARLGGKLKEIMAASKKPDFDPEKWGLLPDEYETRLQVKDGVTGAALPDNTAVVVIDTHITAELEAEGLANDALRFIQDTRKEIGLDVSDRIKLFVACDDKIMSSLKHHEGRIKRDVLATDISYSDKALEYQTEIEGHALSIKVEKI